MSTPSRVSCVVVSALLLGAVVSPAAAVVVNPGDIGVTILGTTEAARPELAGAVVSPDLSSNFTLHSVLGVPLTGTVYSRVVRETTAGTLDFYYQIANTSDQTYEITPTMFHFTGFTTDVDTRTDSTGTLDLHKVSDGGDALTFYPYDLTPSGPISDTYLLPGTMTHWIFIKTNATAFDTNGHVECEALLLNEGLGNGPNVVILASAFEPVPEPATLTLLALGSLGVIGRVVRRRWS